MDSRRIDRRAFLRAVGAGAASWLLAPPAVGRQEKRRETSRPNIVLIIADDLGAGQVSCYPHSLDVHTPNIDSLARSGVRMTSGYSADPMCLPSRASVLTGKYHQGFKSPRHIPQSERRIAESLNQAGYATGYVGKWHNCVPGTDIENSPLAWGFDEFFGFLGGMHDYFDADKGFQTGKGWIYMPVYDGTRPVGKAKYLTEEFTDRAVSFITRHKDGPFFLYVAYTAIHTPNQAPKKYLERYKNLAAPENAWRAMLDVLDDGVGRILDTLKSNGLYGNTMVLFVGDNGGHNRDSNWKLRGFKGDLFEGGIRIPFIISWPKALPQNTTYSAPVVHIDVLPTIFAAAGVEVAKDWNFDGEDLLPYCRGKADRMPHEVLFWGRRRDQYAVRKGDWKLVCNGQRKREPGKDGSGFGLYNLKNDPEEKNNLFKRNKPIVTELMRICEAWSKRNERLKSGG